MAQLRIKKKAETTPERVILFQFKYEQSVFKICVFLDFFSILPLHDKKTLLSSFYNATVILIIYTFLYVFSVMPSIANKARKYYTKKYA